MRRLVAPLFAAALLGAALAMPGCRADADGWPARPGPKAVASFAPIQSIVLAVAGPDAAVKAVMSNQGPHHFDTTLREAQWLAEADLLFANGLDLDTRVCQKLVAATRSKKLKLVELGAAIPKNQLEEGGECPGGHGEAGHVHATDPHVWLGLDHAATFADGVRDMLAEADPAHAAGYAGRAAAFQKQLAELKAEGAKKFAGVKNRKFASFHGSLHYFAKTFNLEVAAVLQTVPGREPTTAELQKLVELCRHEHVRVIAVEPQYSGRTSAELLVTHLNRDKGANARLVEIDPLETANPAEMSGDWYIAKMRANIDALAAALDR